MIGPAVTMTSLSWLDGVFGMVRCAKCGGTYGRDDLTVVGTREEYWFVRCACRTCGTCRIGVVIVKDASVSAAAASTPAVGIDDVLQAHDLLAAYRGDVQGLFEGGPRLPGR